MALDFTIGDRVETQRKVTMHLTNWDRDRRLDSVDV